MASDSGSMTSSVFSTMRAMAMDPKRRTALVHDETCIGGLVLVLSNTDVNIVKSALQILVVLAEHPEHRLSLRNFLGLIDQLESNFMSSDGEIRDLSKQVYALLSSAAPLRDTANQHRQQAEEKHRANGNAKKDPAQRRRRNSFFVCGGIAKSKMIILQIRGMTVKDDADTCRSCLLPVKGVISIIVDFNKKRVTIRCKPDLRPQVLAEAIAKSMTMAAEQVLKDDDGKEYLSPLRLTAESAEKENEDMPDYPEQEISPVGYKNMSRMGGPSKQKNWNFVKSVGNFLSNSFYW